MIILGGQIEGLASRKDKTLRLTIGTQELSPNDSAEVFALNQQFCYIGIKKEPFTKDESELIDSLKTDYETAKTPSQRLRGLLFRNFEINNEGYKDFNTYYIGKIELICNHFKAKLEATH